ncbi:hypothetical protein [Xanthomonas fragariae]|uniref:hypothetical protein n=1 Tax=Xanthomonas fragariae TaxID=48664 RepID=UPI001F3BBBE0|nr:hypothetical protein [Xanthomonas fragariae]
MDIPEPHQLDQIQQRAVFFIMKRSEKMRSTKSSNRRTHAQSTYQSVPEQATGQVASLGAGPSGMPSSSTPSGVLSELAARPNKRRRTQACAVRSAPGSGAHPAPNVTSTPTPSSALHYDGPTPNSRAHHPQLWRAVAPESQGTTEQQPALADAAVAHAAVHVKRPAPVNRPALHGRPSTFAELSDAIRRGTGSPNAETPHPADLELIAQFVDGANKGDAKFGTTIQYAYLLIRFSDWLRQEKKGGLQRVFNDKDKLRSDALTFMKVNKNYSLLSALNHMHDAKSAPHGVVNIRGYRNHKAPDGDAQFIKRAHSVLQDDYASSLRALSAWLHAEGKEGLCETGRLHSQNLMDDAKEFLNTCMAGSAKSVRALRKLRDFCNPGTTDLVQRINRRGIYEVDHQFKEKYKNDLWESSGGKRYADGGTYASAMSSRLGRFTAWLKENKKQPMAWRLHDPTLDRDLDLWTQHRKPKYVSSMKSMLMQVRKMYPPDVQLPDLGGIAEPTGSSYSSMIPRTPEGGWPQAPEGDWNPDMFEDEVTGPSSSAQPEASSYNIPFDWEALYQATTEPQHITEMSQASTLSFDEKDTGPNWKPGTQQVPQWLLQHDVRDNQMVRICGIAYRVFTKQVEADGVNQAKLWLNPEQF